MFFLCTHNLEYPDSIPLFATANKKVIFKVDNWTVFLELLEHGDDLHVTVVKAVYHINITAKNIKARNVSLLFLSQLYKEWKCFTRNEDIKKDCPSFKLAFGWSKDCLTS